MPKRIVKGSTTILYQYDASGRKLRETIGTNTTDYIGNLTYKNNSLYQLSHDEGRIVNGVYEYNIKDHLANLRVTFKDSLGVAKITQSNAYGAWGEDLPTLSYQNTANLNNFKFTEKENLPETGYIDFGARLYDNIIPRFISIDPLADRVEKWSPYSYAFDSPLIFIDPNGMLGEYYGFSGQYLGSDGKNDGNVYAVKEYVSWRSPKKVISMYLNTKDNVKKIDITNDEFINKASTVYGESSAYKSNRSDELRKEMFAIASVHENNSEAYGNNSDIAKKFRSMSPEKRNFTKMQDAIAAEINAQLGGFDYSYGAKQWDGQEQSLFSESDTRKSTGKFELHMNTQGWDISDEHFNKWKSFVGKPFVAPQRKEAIYGFNKGKTRLTSSAVYGGTIFWKTN